jgi:hypothetical protein
VQSAAAADKLVAADKPARARKLAVAGRPVAAVKPETEEESKTLRRLLWMAAVSTR